jgi:colicin import membrane protein
MAVRSTASPAPVPLAVQTPRPETDGTSALAMDAAPLEGTIELLELVKIEPQNVQEMFTKPGALKPLLNKIATEARSIVQDPTTVKGREAIKSLAYKIAQSKTALENQGVALNRELKALPAAVDKNKREAKEFLEALQTEIRKPVTDWEAEQARIEAERVAAEEAAALARQIEADHEIALTLNWAYDQKRREELEAMERDQQAREEEIAREAAEKERLASVQREADLKAATEKAEREKAEAEQRAKDAEAKAEQDRIESEARAAQAKIDADKQAEQAAIEAQQVERNRQAAAKKAEDDATAARTKDTEHRKVFSQEAIQDLIRMTGLDEEKGKAVIGAIAMGRVRHISINY